VNEPQKDFIARRAALTAEIARQRTELSAAFLQLEKPIRYAEYGMRGVGFLRANPWIFAAAPALVSVGSTLWGLWRKKPVRPSQVQAQAGPKPKQGRLKTILGQGMKLYQLYRQVRPYFL
jgi:hypothetical protein